MVVELAVTVVVIPAPANGAAVPVAAGVPEQAAFV